MQLSGDKGVIARYNRYLVNRCLSEHTIRRYCYALALMSQLLASLCGVTELEEVTIDHLREYVEHLLTRPVEVGGRRRPPKNGLTLSPVSVGDHIRVVKTFFNWCYEEDLIEKNPADRLKSPKVDEEIIDTFTEAQIEQMMASFDLSTIQGVRDYVIILLMLDTGIRRAEVSRLEVDDVHETYISVFGKGRKERQVGIHPDISTLLWKYIHKYRKPLEDGESALFLSTGQKAHGKSLTPSGIHWVMQRLKEATGIDEVRLSSHTFRHTFACMYLEEGGDVFSLSREMGHNDVKTTQRYLKMFTSKKARMQHNGHSPINRIKLRSFRSKPNNKPEKK